MLVTIYPTSLQLCLISRLVADAPLGDALPSCHQPVPWQLSPLWPLPCGEAGLQSRS